MSTWPSHLPDVSVVVCTIGRIEPLRACLDALARQEQAPREIIVVAAGDVAGAEAILAGRTGVRAVRVDSLNVSASRNAGVRAAAGEIVAFCDDDAVADRQWLARLAGAFADESVGGAGGRVWDARSNPADVEFENGLVCVSGAQKRVCRSPGQRNDPRGRWCNNVCGCNCAFRRSALEAVGGFDEFIEFAWEESDVCVRMIRAGWQIAHEPRAEVRHGFTPGGYRQDELRRNWRAEIKNHVYFGLKNRIGLSGYRTVLRVLARLAALSIRFARAACAGSISRQEARKFRRDAWKGFREGLRGAARPRKLGLKAGAPPIPS